MKVIRYAMLVIQVWAPCAFGQFGQPSGQSQGTQANTLPLSGRSGQSGSVAVTAAPVPGATTSVNTINPTVQVQGPYTGSIDSTSRKPFSGKLSFQEAVQRGIAYNLGSVGAAHLARQSQGQSRVARSALLPNINGNLSETVQQTNLRAAGVRISAPIPGFSIPSIVGPFNYFDLRASLTQNIADFTALNNYRSSQELLRANELSIKDARDMVVLAVGGAYLQVIAAQARVESARAQLETAEALLKQTTEQRNAGIAAPIDVNRSTVQAQMQQQRLVTLRNDLAKQKINMARMTGLPPNDQYELSDAAPSTQEPPDSLESAIAQAFENRSDLKAAQAQVRAAERARAAARAERWPSLAVSGNYGVIGTNPAQSHGTFGVTGTLRIPIWQGGRTEGNIEQADAALAQRQAEVADLRARIEAEVRSAWLDLQAATSQVDVAQKNLDVTRQNLDLNKQRFQEGVTDNVEVVRSQESVAEAELDSINSIFAQNIARLSLARARGATGY